MANTTLTRTAGSPTNSKKFTMSGWFKPSDTTENQFFQTFVDSSNREHMYFTSDKLKFYIRHSNSQQASLETNRLFRDRSAWYHIVIACDSTQGTASDRMKMYINGVQETSFNNPAYPTQNYDFKLNTNSAPLIIGRYGGSNSYYYNGLISHFHFCDGSQLAPTVFGSTDSTTGEWKINTSPSFTLGNNGFTILKDGNTITDQSANSNNFSLGSGTLTKSEDCPSNVFAVLNKNLSGAGALSNGNTTITRSASSWQSMVSTLGLPPTGKFYCEFKIASGTNHRFGICDDIANSVVDKIQKGAASEMGEQTNSLAYLASNGNSYINASSGSYGASISSSNVLGMAIDMTNMKLYFSKDGVFQNSGNPESGATGTGALAIPTTIGTYFIGITNNASSTYLNFGNGYFGTTAVSSAGTNASGIGIFEYNVPTGYTALSTKGLNL